MIKLRTELAAGLLDSAPDPECVRSALQTAIRLEHATIPPYLYALYSLKHGTNERIAELIQSVVVEEMGHMVLAANVLNAIGGSPVLDTPEVLPAYPHVLPGSVESELEVGLAPFTIELVHNAFMVIEEPEKVIPFPVGARALVAEEEELTIGQFYGRISAAIARLDPSVFHKDRNQVTVMGGPAVTDATSAQTAIHEIVEQGEGTTTSPLESPDSKRVAHFYRFSEIFYGRMLVADATVPEGYSYSGEVVPYDDTGTWALPLNPKLAAYEPGSVAHSACRTFNYTYTDLLKTLHALLNGHPEVFNNALGMMFSMRQQALDMAAGTFNNNVPIGPSFEYQPVNG